MTRLFSNTHFRIFIIATLAMMTTACGFHFRGNYLLPDEVETLSVTSFDDYAMITREVKKQLARNGVKVVPPGVDVANLHIINDSDGDRTLSLYQNARAAEYELFYNTSYKVTVPGYNTKTYNVHITRSYLDNPMAALAKSVEKDVILEEMKIQASQQILRQMATLKTQLIVVGSPDPSQQQDFPTEVKDTNDTITQDLDNGVQQTSTTKEVTSEDMQKNSSTGGSNTDSLKTDSTKAGDAETNDEQTNHQDQ